MGPVERRSAEEAATGTVVEVIRIRLPRWCANCGQPVSPRRRRFCGECGRPFRHEHRSLRDRHRSVGTRLTRIDRKNLRPGDVVKPGTWGRAVRRSRSDPQSILPWEVLLERVRREEFPGLPSRMSAAFAYEGVPERHPPDMGGYLNLVRKARDVNAFRADMAWMAGVDASTPDAEANAREYWSGKPTEAPIWEWLVDGPLEIVGPVPERTEPRARRRR